MTNMAAGDTSVGSTPSSSALLELTPVGQTTKAVHRTTMRAIRAGVGTRCLHRFSNEVVTPGGGIEDPDHPIIGQWVNPNEKIEDEIEVEFTEIEDGGTTIAGRDCIRYAAGQTFLDDFGTGSKKRHARVSADGRTVTTERSLGGHRTRTDTYTVEDDGTMTRRWVVRKSAAVVYRDEAKNERGVSEDGCLAHTTRTTE